MRYSLAVCGTSGKAGSASVVVCYWELRSHAIA